MQIFYGSTGANSSPGCSARMLGRAPIGCCMVDYSQQDTTREREREKARKIKCREKKILHSKFLKQKSRQKIVKISTGLT